MNQSQASLSVSYEEKLQFERGEKKRIQDELEQLKSQSVNQQDIGRLRKQMGDLQAVNRILEQKLQEASKVAAQGAQGFSYLRKKRKWEMTEEELEAYRIVQHHGDDPMAKFIKD